MVLGLDLSVIILMVILGIIGGLIIAGLYFLFKVFTGNRKSTKQWTNGKGVMKLKNNPKQIIKEDSGFMGEQ